MGLLGRSLTIALALTAPGVAAALGQTWRGLPSCDAAASKAGSPDDTIANCTRLIDAGGIGGPALIDLLLVRASAYEAKRDYKLLIVDVTKAIEINPSSGILYTMRASGYLRTGELDRAIEDLTKLIEQDDRNGLGYGMRAEAYSRKGEHEHAIADATRAIELIDAQAARAVKAFEARRDAPSAPALPRPPPGNPDAYTRRARIYLDAGNVAQALVDADRALELSQKMPNSFYTRAQILEAEGRREDAILNYREALRLAPDLKAYQDALRRLGVEP
jgi:tetratricopeptide (TPR) repeat protein